MIAEAPPAIEPNTPTINDMFGPIDVVTAEDDDGTTSIIIDDVEVLRVPPGDDAIFARAAARATAKRIGLFAIRERTP